jgi:phospholipid/cholesterol/gamma-HCH transport system substrate-binding protein
VSVLADQRAEITQVLTGLNRLGTVAVRVIQASQQNTTADLRALEPILTQLNRAGNDLPASLELLTTYPFPKTVDEGIKGDYANLFVTADINLVGAAGNTGVLPGPIASLLPTGAPVVPGAPRVPGLTVPKVPAPAPAPSLLPRVPVLGGLAAGDNRGLLRLLLGGMS